MKYAQNKCENEIQCELLVDLKCFVNISAYNCPKLLLCGSELVVYDVDSDYSISNEFCDVQKVYSYNK